MSDDDDGDVVNWSVYKTQQLKSVENFKIGKFEGIEFKLKVIKFVSLVTSVIIVCILFVYVSLC